MSIRRRRRFIASTGVLLVALAAGAPAVRADAPPDPGAIGPFSVGHASFPGTFFFLDTARGNRSLPTEVWYPVDPGDDVGDGRYEEFLTREYALANLPAVAFDRRGVRACGLGPEPVLLLPLLWLARRRRRLRSA